MNPEGLPFFINPFVLRTPPLYFALQNTGEEGNPLLIAVRYPAYGARQGRIVIQRTFFPSQSPCYTNSLYLFILLSSEKNEQRSAAAVIGLLAFRYGRRRGLRNSFRSDSPRPFPFVSLASSPPDKGGIGDCCFCLYSNPLALRALPLYFCCAKHPAMLRDTARGECDTRFVAADVFFNPSVFSTPPYFGHLPYILLCKTPRNATGHGRGGG